MNVIIVISIRFFTAVCNASVQLWQNESPYMIAMVVSFIGLRNDYKSYYKPKFVIWLPLLFHIYRVGRTTQNKCDTVNREYTVGNSKTNIRHIHICFVIIIVITSTKLALKLLWKLKHTKHTLLTYTSRILPVAKITLCLSNNKISFVVLKFILFWLTSFTILWTNF
jgi:hypothetical protein